MEEIKSKIIKNIARLLLVANEEDNHDPVVNCASDLKNQFNQLLETVESLKCCGNCNYYKLHGCHIRKFTVQVCGDEKCKNWTQKAGE